jgi:hypothetical protein
MAIFVLFGLMLFLMLMRVHLPFGARIQGKAVKSVLLSLSERSLLQRRNVYSLGFVLLISALTGMLVGPAEVLVVVVALAIMSLPVRLLLTSEGVALNNVVYRPWNEFSGFSIERRRIVLHGREGLRPFSLPLLGVHQREVLPELRRHLKEVHPSSQAAAIRATRAV